MNRKQVIFLGAGASAADGAPIQNQLFRSYFDNGLYDNDQELKDFFRDFFGISTGNNIEEIEFPTFEEVLGILEISLSRGESFRGYSFMPNNPKIQSIKEKIIFLIAKILKEELRYHRPNHDRLVRRLHTEGNLRRTSFISLNYDILIDNTLTDFHHNCDLDYAVDFTNFGKRNDWHKPRKPIPNKKVQRDKLTQRLFVVH